MKNFFLTIITLLGLFSAAGAQTIYTLAGNGIGGFSGDGGPASAAQIQMPGAIATDASGNVYIAQDYRIRKISSSGIITTVVGTGTPGYSGDGGPATIAQIANVQALGVDASGNLYIGDGNRIRKVNPAGIISSIVGDGNAGSSGDGGPATSAQIHDPCALAFDLSGNIYIADNSNHRVRKVNASGIITTVAGEGNPGYYGDGGPATSAEIYSPSGVAVDNAGNLYIAEQANNIIRKVNAAGIISTIAGTLTSGFTGDNGPATAAKMWDPQSLALDGAGNLYFADVGNNRIRKISASGIITTVAGNGSQGFSGDGGAPTSARLYGPWCVAVDASNNIYIADQLNFRIRAVCPSNCIAGIKEIEQTKLFSIYPNPASNVLCINSQDEDLQNSEIEILNTLGQTVIKTPFKNQIDVSALPNSIYFLQVNY
ncbi:MAG: NHL domain-containing protein, partial [Mucilaginibacter sp.]